MKPMFLQFKGSIHSLKNMELNWLKAEFCRLLKYTELQEAGIIIFGGKGDPDNISHLKAIFFIF